MEIITITKQEAIEIFYSVAPSGFRFAKVADFHNDGVRVEELQIFISQWSKECRLSEYLFTSETSRNWLQWLLNKERVFIRTGERPGKRNNLSYFIMPTEEFLINELNE